MWMALVFADTVIRPGLSIEIPNYPSYTLVAVYTLVVSSAPNISLKRYSPEISQTRKWVQQTVNHASRYVLMCQLGLNHGQISNLIYRRTITTGAM